MLPLPKAALTVRQLSAAPIGSTAPIITGITFDLAAGEGLGILGLSGSGKSSLARTLCGVWSPGAGEIRFDGALLRHYDPTQIGRMIGYLPQRADLFEGTVAENIGRFSTDASSEDIIAADGSLTAPAADTASEVADEDLVDERTYRYPGPKPQSREAAILMLADGVEASVRSLDEKDEESIRGMVDRIVEARVEDGQLDDADLTLRDIALIKDAFVGQLLGMYHSRIKYPDNVVPMEGRREQA